MTTDEIRALSGVAGIAAAASLPGADPIFAAIGRHWNAWARYSVLGDSQDKAALEAARVAEHEALEALLDTPPQTKAGARAIIEWFVFYDDGCDPVASGRYLPTLLDSPLLAEEVR